MLERVADNASGDIIDVYTDPDGIWPALCEAVLRLKVQWPRYNVLQLPLAMSVAWDKCTDKLGHEIEKRNERDPLLAPAVGLEGVEVEQARERWSAPLVIGPRRRAS